MNSWKYLNFWRSEEWNSIEEELDDMDFKGIKYWPKRVDMFRALHLVPSTGVRVLIVGQDPYPNEKMATGVAFAIPQNFNVIDFPPTLVNILTEYQEDLGVVLGSFDLERWCHKGVLLWNVYPIYDRLGRMKRQPWEELTKEIVQECNKPGVVQVFLGAVARKFAPKPVEQYDPMGRVDCVVLEYSHPSPLGVSKGSNPFKGSRMFSTINSHLKPPIDWSL